MANEANKHVRINPITGEKDYYFPLEYHPSLLQCAKANHLDIVSCRLGDRSYKAIMIPCKRIGTDERGNEVFLDTPSEEQHERYRAYVSFELNEQDRIKQNRRCNIPDEKGGTKRCPARKPNPDYLPGNGQPKTLPVRCEGCIFERFKHAENTVVMSSLDSEDEDGTPVSFEGAAPFRCDQAWRYERLKEDFAAYVAERKPKLQALAKARTDGYTQTEHARATGASVKTVNSQMNILKQLAIEFLDTVIDM